ncbi:MAG TPA: helix-turn-helix transcriptional regulator [Acidimicrobiales bacterium]|nr:helix-turn-helix transcriptional regulator [Acidimicrobiales bacterium]
MAGGDDRRVALDSPTIGQALERRRDQLALSREAAASAVGVSRSTYSAYESDQRRLSPEALRILANFLGADLEEILHLYGATCIAQARRSLVGDASDTASTGARVGLRRAARSDDMTIVERVYFDAGARERHDVVALAPRGADPPFASHADDVVVDGTGATKHEKTKKKAKKEKRGKKKDKGAKKSPKRHASKSTAEPIKKSKVKKGKSKSKKGKSK